MCGRFRIAKKKEILEEAFEVDAVADDGDWVPRYNVAPMRARSDAETMAATSI